MAKQLVITRESMEDIAGGLRRLRSKLTDEMAGMDPLTLIKDLKGDLGQLEPAVAALMGQNDTSGGEDMAGAEARREQGGEEARRADEARRQEEARRAGEGRREGRREQEEGRREQEEGRREGRREQEEGRREGRREQDSEARRADEARRQEEGRREARGREGDPPSGDWAGEDPGFRPGTGAGDPDPQAGDAGRSGMADHDTAKGKPGFRDDPVGRTDEAREQYENGNGMQPAGPRMQYKCAACGEANEVNPPKGFRLARADEEGMEARRMGESQALRQTVARLTRLMESKETRFATANEEKRRILRENISLRAKVVAYERADTAAAMLREANIPRDMLNVEDLLAFEPHQWAYEIRAIKRALRRESQQHDRGGYGERSGGTGRPREGGDGAEAVAAFRESFNRRRAS